MHFTTPLFGTSEKTDERVHYTSLDAMKFFAVIGMTIDHIGEYFFPEYIWLRAPARITIPVWFFLIGYSRARAIPKELWWFALLLIADRLLLGLPLSPLNVLISIILCRYVINYCEDHDFLRTRLPEIMALCILLSIATVPLFEYGSMGILLAIYGRLIRENITKNFRIFAMMSYLLFVGWQISWWDFNTMELLYIFFGTAWVMYWLATFSNAIIFKDWKHSWWKYTIAVLSRNTALYYCLHRLIFEVIAHIV